MTLLRGAVVTAALFGWMPIAAYADDAGYDLQKALSELARAQETVRQLSREIVIEGADTVEMGGEIRAARMAEAQWRRALEALSAHAKGAEPEIVSADPPPYR